MAHKHRWTQAEWTATDHAWASFHAQYPAISAAQWRYARQQRHDAQLRGPQTDAEQRVADQLRKLATYQRRQGGRVQGSVLGALRDWWQDTRGTP